jgi:predicted NBD/HSP70 family sugar kinase
MPEREKLSDGGPLSRTDDQRRRNLSETLRCVAQESGKISRATIAARTGLHRSTVGHLVDELVGGGLVHEVGTISPTRAGRPPTALAVSPRGPVALGLDVNVGYVAACLVDLTGAVRYEHVIAQDQRGRPMADVLNRVSHLARDALRAVAGNGRALCGTAVAVPGLVDLMGGVLATAPNLGWHDLDVAQALRRQGMPGPIALDNESNFAALSEEELLRDGESFLYVNGQFGVGAGIVIEGRLHRGQHGWSGEIGHTIVVPDGPRCACGRHGCLETYAGHEAILRAVGVSHPASTSLGLRPTVCLIRERAEHGEARTVEALRRTGSVIGIVVAGCLNILDVDRVVLGGIYRDLSPWIAPAVGKEVAGRLCRVGRPSPVVKVARHGPQAPALGAARSVVRGLVQDPVAWLARAGTCRPGPRHPRQRAAGSG